MKKRIAKVLGIAGSPRKGGNSDILLDNFLKGAGDAGCETEKIYASHLNIAPCDENNTCHRTGECRIKDEMQAVYKRLIEADCIVVSSPTFFMGVPAQLKCLIDRCQALWARRFVLKRPLREDDKERDGYLLATSGLNKKEAFLGTKATVKAFFYVLGFRYKDEVLAGGIDKMGDINRQKGALDKAYKIGRSIL